MTWAQSAQQSFGQHAQFARSMSGGCDQRQAFQQLQQLQSAASAPEAALASLGPTAHRCTRFCDFEHLFGNMYLCRSSGSHHCCDSNCDQTVRVSTACVLFAMCSHFICTARLSCSGQGSSCRHRLRCTCLTACFGLWIALHLCCSYAWVRCRWIHTPQSAG